MKHCSSGIAHLDELLGGGLPKPSVILICGAAGSGKTTMALQSISKAAENGETVLYLPITSQSFGKLTDYLNCYPFFNDNIIRHPIDRSTAEKDPLTTLLDIGNILASTNPDRVVVNPITPLGFGFPPHERRRFYYSFDAMLQDWSALTLITGELTRNEIHHSVLPHIADGVIYLDREMVGHKIIRRFEIMKLRGMPHVHTNFSTSYEFKIEPDGIRIFPKLDSVTGNVLMSENRLSTSIDGLDRMMHGGIPEYSSMLVIGGPGVGKTLLGIQYIVAGLKLGEPGIIVLFEEREGELINEAASLGRDLKSYIDQGLLRIIYSSPHNISPDEHNLIIRSCVKEINAKRLLFDGVYNLESVIPDPVEFRNHVKLLIDFLKGQGVTTMLTNQVPELFAPEKMPELNISSMADGIIMLHFLDHQNRYERAMSILKLRGSDHDRAMRKYIIGDNGIEIVQKRFTAE